MVLRKLRAQGSGSFIEALRIFFRPPIPQRAGGIDLAPLIVKAMRQFVTDNRTGRAVINRRIGIRVENRWLKNARRKNNVPQAAVVGIVSLWSHVPVRSIDGPEETPG